MGSTEAMALIYKEPTPLMSKIMETRGHLPLFPEFYLFVLPSAK
jgi:hypothetical protein